MWLDNVRLYRANQIIELLYVKNGYADLPDFSVSEIDCFYRAMHFSAYARSWDCMSSVCDVGDL